MKKMGGFRKWFRLADVLIYGSGEQKDEYSSRQMEKGAYRMAQMVIGLGAALAVFYLSKKNVNRTQFSAMAFAILTLAVAGRAYVNCVMGTLPASDRYDGRHVFGLGGVVVFLHCSLVLPTRYQFGGNLFFWDMGLVGVLIYYLACEVAWRSWETYQNVLDEADGQQAVQHAKKLWIVKNAAAGVLLGGMILVPALLGFAVYDSDTMAQAEAMVKAAEEERKTPEYLEYERFQEQWQEPEEYVMVYQIPLKAYGVGNQVRESYERAGALYIRTKEKDMTILFYPKERGAEILQSNYQDYTQENPMESEHVYIRGAWYRTEEWMQKQNEPGFASYEVEAYHFSGGHVSFPGVKALDSISEDVEDGNRRLNFYYSKAYLDEMDAMWKRMGVYSGESLSEQQSLLIDPDGQVIEQQTCSVKMKEETVNLVVHKEEVADWQISRYLTRDGAEANAMFEKFVEQGPEVLEEVLEIYKKMMPKTGR